MMRREQKQWVADSYSDLDGWDILTDEPWKTGVQRMMILRGIEQRIVYVKTSVHPETRNVRPQTLIRVIENGLANTVVQAMLMSGGHTRRPIRVIVHRDVVIGELLELVQ